MDADGITPDGYVPRVVDAEMRRALATMPAVVVEGPRACGKTWTGRRFANSAVYLDDRVSAALDAGMDPASILDGSPPRLLDEWQLAPGVWNPMRRACDARGMRGQFILTGSADPPDDITRHSGAGRIIRVRMRPMSLYESGESDGGVSLGALLDGERCAAADAGLGGWCQMGLAGPVSGVGAWWRGTVLVVVGGAFGRRAGFEGFAGRGCRGWRRGSGGWGGVVVRRWPISGAGSAAPARRGAPG